MIDIDEVSYKRTKFRQAGLEAAAGIASEGDTAASDAANASAPGHVRISAKSGFEAWSEKLLHGREASFRYAVRIPLGPKVQLDADECILCEYKKRGSGLELIAALLVLIPVLGVLALCFKAEYGVVFNITILLASFCMIMVFL
ncbi:MAG: hypothetical protein KH703_03880 [Campylobacter gracilis]|uniref:hypothetical protein n=1 Tax=Campylobacter gracilis TaxID=824 RepID=UPI0026F08DBD|nr:hypothetical protein [Campylobacter gracilis]MBS6152539.1 hypothetical protein [Campylobacter gracilis]